MGRVKEMMIEAEELGFEIDGSDQFVCEQCCFDDEYVKEMVVETRQNKECSYCGRLGAAPVFGIMKWMMSCICDEWSNDPRGCGAGYDSETGDYMFPRMVKSADEVLSEVGLAVNDEKEFHQYVMNSMSPEWCRPWWNCPLNESLLHGWDFFSAQVEKLCQNGDVDIRKNWPDIKIPDAVNYPDGNNFDNVCAEITRHARVRVLKNEDVIYRARREIYNTESELLAPPPGVSPPNRMSPAGIPVLYGGMNAITAFSEIADESADCISIGIFRVTAEISVLDLSNFPEVPSFFGPERHIREQIIFLWRFAWEIAQPVAKDGAEHLEYAPTQIFAAHLAKIKTQKRKIDGVIYRSSKCDDGECCAIFPHVAQGGSGGNLRLEKSVYLKKDADGKWRRST